MGYVLGLHKDNMYIYIYLVGVENYSNIRRKDGLSAGKAARAALNHK